MKNSSKINHLTDGHTQLRKSWGSKISGLPPVSMCRGLVSPGATGGGGGMGIPSLSTPPEVLRLPGSTEARFSS